MKVITVPCLYDNYAYLVVDEASSLAIIVDPSEGMPLLRELAALSLAPAGVLCTHHHGDHVGGLPEILEPYPDLPVYAHERDKDRIPGVTQTVRRKDEVTIGKNTFQVLHVPGHTLGAVAWVIDGVAFTGDTLFVGGCGRVFEGTAAMLYESIHDVIGSLAPDTQIYCGHEYTLSNLRFALHVEPTNQAVKAKIEQVTASRERKEPSVPSTLAEELQINPFLRCSEAAVVEFAREHDAGGVDPLSVFAALRASKNQFRG